MDLLKWTLKQQQAQEWYDLNMQVVLKIFCEMQRMNYYDFNYLGALRTV